MRYTGPKARLCRREGINLFGTEKYAKIMDKKPGKPGMHKTGGRPTKQSEYAKQLREKQKLKIMFGLNEKQLRRVFDEARKNEGLTATNLLKKLETRLDNVVYRAGMARTRMQARQMVSHGLLTINDRRINVPSAQVSVGDKIQVRDNKKNSPLFQGFKELKKDVSPTWMEVEKNKLSIEIKSIPADDEVEQIIDTAPVVEFYSR